MKLGDTVVLKDGSKGRLKGMIADNLGSWVLLEGRNSLHLFAIWAIDWPATENYHPTLDEEAARA